MHLYSSTNTAITIAQSLEAVEYDCIYAER